VTRAEISSILAQPDTTLARAVWEVAYQLALQNEYLLRCAPEVGNGRNAALDGREVDKEGHSLCRRCRTPVNDTFYHLCKDCYNWVWTIPARPPKHAGGKA